MKKDGIQTRNRKMTSKSKRKKGLGGSVMADLASHHNPSMDFFKQNFERQFTTFPQSQPFTSPLHPTNSYLGSNMNTFMTSPHAPAHTGGHLGFGAAYDSGFPMQASSFVSQQTSGNQYNTNNNSSNMTNFPNLHVE